MAPVTLLLISDSPEMTRILGYALGQNLQAGDVVCLSGDLGAGKTTFSGGVGQGWGAESPLTSPTFVIVHQHNRPMDKQVLYHLDAYRLEKAGDADSIGLDDILDGTAAVLIEWAERIQSNLPPDCLWISLAMDGETSRRLTLSAQVLLEGIGRAASH
jgi:tRNA threonylcarbamoyladenosine biosynthesis protein TsaE